MSNISPFCDEFTISTRACSHITKSLISDTQTSVRQSNPSRVCSSTFPNITGTPSSPSGPSNTPQSSRFTEEWDDTNFTPPITTAISAEPRKRAWTRGRKSGRHNTCYRPKPNKPTSSNVYISFKPFKATHTPENRFGNGYIEGCNIKMSCRNIKSYADRVAAKMGSRINEVCKWCKQKKRKLVSKCRGRKRDPGNSTPISNELNERDELLRAFDRSDSESSQEGDVRRDRLHVAGCMNDVSIPTIDLVMQSRLSTRMASRFWTGVGERYARGYVSKYNDGSIRKLPTLYESPDAGSEESLTENLGHRGWVGN